MITPIPYAENRVQPDSRFQAARVALHAGQIDKIPVVLTSEDLWDVDGGALCAPEPEPVRPVKCGRNDPCHCGSGKKHKKCCGG